MPGEPGTLVGGRTPVEPAIGSTTTAAMVEASPARFFVPPYIDPYDPNVDPILQQEINQLGYAMVADLTRGWHRTGHLVRYVVEEATR